MKGARAMRWLGGAAPWIVAAVFAVSGGLKLADPARFAGDIGNYRLVPGWGAAALAVYLPWLELALAAGLAAPRGRPVAGLLGLGLLAVFCGVLISAGVRGLDVSCGCFGASWDTSIGHALLRNAVLGGLLLAARREWKCDASRI